jgi:large subunit ribosomal protein L31
MKQGIHPEYREVIFHDISCDFAFLTRSTVRPKDSMAWKDGKTYPSMKVEISSASHPYFTGKHKFIDTAGRVEKFQKKFGWGQKKEKEEPSQEKA